MTLTIAHLAIICGALFSAGTCFGALIMCLVQVNREDKLPPITNTISCRVHKGD